MKYHLLVHIYLIYRKEWSPVLILLVLFIGFNGFAIAQEKIFEVNDSSDLYSINEYISILEDPEAKMTIADVKGQDMFFKALSSDVVLEKYSTYWAKLQLTNKSSSHRWVLSPDWNKGTKRNNFVEVYFPEGDSVSNTGRFLPYSKRKGITKRASDNQVLIDIKQDSSLTLYLKIWQINGQNPVLDVNLLEYAYWRGETKELRNVAQGFFQGIVWIMLLYSLVNYWSLKDEAYLYYAIFLFSTSIYFLYLSGILLETLLREYPTYSYYFWIFSTNLVAIGYFQFARSFLKAKKNIPYWDKIGKRFIIGLIILAILETIYLYLTFDQNSLNQANNIIILLQGIFLLVVSLLYINGTYKLGRIFAFGTLFIVMAGFSGVSLEYFGLTQRYLPLIGLFFILQIIAFSRGLSYRHLLVKEQRLLKKAEADSLRTLDQMKSQFFADISHEFRTPLTVLMGSLDNLKKENINKEKKQETWEAAYRNSSYLLKLVNQVLDLSKLESKSMPVNFQYGDVIVFINYIVESFGTFAASQNINFSYKKSIDSLYMDFDPEALQSILFNLISNAIKFSEKQGNVHISVQERIYEDEVHLEISVEDSGVGIQASELPHIFERYYQSKTSKDKNSVGTGIGLALVKEQIHLLGGEIFVESELNQGATFFFRLPIRNNYKSEIQDSTSLNPKPIELFPHQVESKALSKKGIPDFDLDYLLIIEDNPDIVKYLVSILEDKYRLGVARNGAEGIKLGIEMVPDLIISDVMMPEKDGFEVCLTLKEDLRTSHIPIILLTARTSQEDLLQGLEKGADAYISKPFEQKELLLRIENLIEQRKQLQLKYSSEDSSIQKSTNEKEHAFVKEAKRLVEVNLDNEGFDIEELCNKMEMTYTQFYRKLKALTNLTASVFIREIRLEKAYGLLTSTDLRISEIAYDVGFKDPAYFSREFSKKYGLPPTAVKS